MIKKELKSLPNGPKGALIQGSRDEFIADRLGFLGHCHSNFGDVVPFRVGPRRMLLLSDPDLIHEVLVSQSNNFSKGPALRNNRRVFGQGLLTSEGELWQRQRKLSSPAFSPRRLEAYSQTMVTHADKSCQRWQDGQVLDVHHEMMDMTLRIAA